jgi:general secretion pathway protein K
MSRRARRHEEGFALLLVLWVLAILAVLATGFAAGMQSQTRLARNLVDAARARALAEAGVARATAALIDTDPKRQWAADGRPYEFAFDGGSVRLRLQDENGKIDINAAPLELIAGLCAEFEIDPGVAAALVQGIAARRRAAAAAASSAGQTLGFGPPSMQSRQAAAFSTVEELRQLPSLDQASFERLRPFLTVYSESPRVDPAVAPREVLLALPGVDPRQVESLLRARAAATSTNASLPTLSGVEAYAGPGQRRAVTITAEARTASGAAFTRHAVIAFTGMPFNPVVTLEWHQELGAESASSVALPAEAPAASPPTADP